MKFDVGDRVRAVTFIDDTYYGDIEAGTEETVTRIWDPEDVPYPYFVAFDNEISQRDPHLVTEKEIEHA